MTAGTGTALRGGFRVSGAGRNRGAVTSGCMDQVPSPPPPFRVLKLVQVARAAGWLCAEIRDPRDADRAWVIYPPRSAYWRDEYVIRWRAGQRSGKVRIEVHRTLAEKRNRSVRQSYLISRLRGAP